MKFNSLRSAALTITLSVASACAWAELVVAQVAPFTGPLADAGQQLSAGARVYFDAVNARGGVFGEKIRLVTKDDGYQPAETVRLVREVLERDKPVALLGLLGTQNVESVLKSGVLDQQPIAVVGVSSGARSLREPSHRSLFHIRASYRDEVQKIAEQLGIMGLTRVAVFYQDDAFGQDALAALDEAAAARKLQIVARVAHQRNTTNVGSSVEPILRSDPQALVLLSPGRPGIGLLKAFRTDKTKSIHVFGLSLTDGAAAAAVLGSDLARGIGISQVMPNAYARNLPLVREFQDHLKQYGAAGTQPSYTLLEGYLGAKTLVEALQRAGRHPTPAKVRTALETMNNYDAGGFFISFSPGQHEGSRYVELSVVGGNGRPQQ